MTRLWRDYDDTNDGYAEMYELIHAIASVDVDDIDTMIFILIWVGDLNIPIFV